MNTGITNLVKWCNKCKTSKPLSEFYPLPTTKHGVEPYCKPCKLGLNIKYRKANKITKTRHPNSYCKGSKKWSAKINEDDVRLINALIYEGLKPANIAEKFDVSVKTIYRIKNGETWKHVT